MSPEKGFELMKDLSPFNALVGPLYRRDDAKGVSIGLRVEEKHTNSRGICHGGLLATLADLALGYALVGHGDKLSGSFFTVQLSIDYASPAKTGDWIASEVEIQQAGARLAFANCYLVAGGRRIARASAIFARAGKSE
jgi:acyl-coenzyme A thioesterase 13